MKKQTVRQKFPYEDPLWLERGKIYIRVIGKRLPW